MPKLKAQGITVKELKEILSKINDKAVIGIMGHYGEFYGMESEPRYVKFREINNIGLQCEFTKPEYADGIILDMPYLGPEPD